MPPPTAVVQKATVPMYQLVGDQFARKGGRTLALIQCDHPTVGSTDLALWRNMVHATEEDEIKVFNACTKELPPIQALRDNYDAVVVMGGRSGVHDKVEWISDLLEFIREVYTKTTVKVVGGCFGHQAVAVALGGEDCVARNKTGEFCLTVENIQAASRQEPYRIVETHGDEVVKLPPGAERLATSKTASNEMFVIGDRVLSFQCHPEIPRFEASEIAHRLDERGVVYTSNAKDIIAARPIDQLQFLEDFLYPFLDGKLINKRSL